MPSMLYHEVDETYVLDLEEGGGEFKYTEYKALGKVFPDDAAARKFLHDNIELEENRFPHIIVSDVLDPKDAAIGALMLLSAEDRLDVLTDFCLECGEPHRPHCRRDLDLA